MKSKKETLGSRVLVAIFHTVVAFSLIAAIQFLVFLKAGTKTNSDIGFTIMDSSILWYGTIVSFIVSFILGSKNMAHLWGVIFRTNKNQ